MIVNEEVGSYLTLYQEVFTTNAKSVQETSNHDRKQLKEAAREDDKCL